MECRFLVQHVLMKFTALFTATLDRAWILLNHFVHYQCNLTGVISLPKRQLKRKNKDKKQIEASILPIFTHRDFFFVLIVVSPPKKS